MKKILKMTAAASMVGLLALAAAGCGGDKAAKNAVSADKVKFGVTNFADSLDPTDNYCSWAVIRYGLGETLVKFDDQMNAVPWLADKWSISDDKLTWTFHINDKVRFSNGDKLTAEIAKESIERTFKLNSRAQAMFQYDEIRAEGENLIIKTKTPVPTLPGMMGEPLFIIINTKVADRDLRKEGPICTGPYTVKSYSKAKAEMVANPKYWDGEVP
ncbi:bacterial extracellular solute-binding protein, family 5, partial [gut metagenome]